MVCFDVPHVFRVFGGPKGLLTALDKHLPGHALAYNTVQMWARRQTIPTKWIGAILYCVLQSGHQCREFLTDSDELGV
jgi:hypothetical protein